LGAGSWEQGAGSREQGLIAKWLLVGFICKNNITIKNPNSVLFGF
jgi:hypothetical protein